METSEHRHTSPLSDVDYAPTNIAKTRGVRESRGPFDLVAMQNELRAIFGREVDLVERSAVEQSENYIRRKSILHNQKVIYAAR
jgi:predicted nucleotidyltransferase